MIGADKRLVFTGSLGQSCTPETQSIPAPLLQVSSKNSGRSTRAPEVGQFLLGRRQYFSASNSSTARGSSPNRFGFRHQLLFISTTTHTSDLTVSQARRSPPQPHLSARTGPFRSIRPLTPTFERSSYRLLQQFVKHFAYDAGSKGAKAPVEARSQSLLDPVHQPRSFYPSADLTSYPESRISSPTPPASRSLEHVSFLAAADSRRAPTLVGTISSQCRKPSERPGRPQVGRLNTSFIRSPPSGEDHGG